MFNNISLEIEITCLVNELPLDLESKEYKEIKQGYFSDGGGSLRIRQKGNTFELTKKEQIDPSDFSKHKETTIYIKQEEFEKLWPQVVKSLEKKRYFYPLKDNLIAEVDVFGGKLKGLVLVEVEFPNESFVSSFQRPVWFGKDVTQEQWSSGEFLAGKSFDEIKSQIK